jgi:hypothetical protein
MTGASDICRRGKQILNRKDGDAMVVSMDVEETHLLHAALPSYSTSSSSSTVDCHPR